jgi:hypothetical protein
MKEIKVSYFVERERSGDVIATAEQSVELEIKHSIFNELQYASADPENNKPLQILSNALKEIAKLQGYNFVSIKTIEEVGKYEYN